MILGDVSFESQLCRAIHVSANAVVSSNVHPWNALRSPSVSPKAQRSIQFFTAYVKCKVQDQTAKVLLWHAHAWIVRVEAVMYIFSFLSERLPYLLWKMLDTVYFNAHQTCWSKPMYTAGGFTWLIKLSRPNGTNIDTSFFSPSTTTSWLNRGQWFTFRYALPLSPNHIWAVWRSLGTWVLQSMIFRAKLGLGSADSSAISKKAV